MKQSLILSELIYFYNLVSFLTVHCEACVSEGRQIGMLGGSIRSVDESFSK